MVTKEDLAALIFDNTLLNYEQSYGLAVIIFREYNINIKDTE